MRICLLTNQDLESETIREDDWPADPRPFIEEATWEVVVLTKNNAVSRVIELSRQGFDLFFNLCDGAWDEDNPGLEVVQTLERLNLPFTGATSDCYEPSREAMKRACLAFGIDTPAYVVATTEEDVTRAAETLRFPLFVKHPSSYASVGLTRESRVTTLKALRKQARRTMTSYGAALIEEFIEGTECTVLVAENPEDPENPTTYTPIQYRFPDGESFKHEDMKWVIYGEMEGAPVQDAALGARLREASARFFVAMNGAGYGRCDIRVDADGRPFMLEINANCGLYYEPKDAGSADLCLLADPAGHEGFTRQIVAVALARQRRRERGWEVRTRADGSHGVFSSRAVVAGERLVVFEERPHTLVTQAHAEQRWSGRRRDHLMRHGWPLSDELWAAWPRDPEEWTPIHHACDPSGWLEGLDVVARRPLAAGQEITLDYATCHDERMPSFACRCGAAACRGTIRGEDHLAGFVSAYDGHLSEHVRRRRAGQGR